MIAGAFIPETAAEASRLRRRHPDRMARTYRDLFWLRACFWSHIDRLNGSCGCFLGFRWDGEARRVDRTKPAVVVLMPPDRDRANAETALGGPGLMLFAPATPWDGQPLWCWTDALVVRRQPAPKPAAASRWIDGQPARGSRLLSGEAVVGQLAGTIACAWAESDRRLAVTAAHVAGPVGARIKSGNKPAKVWGKVVRACTPAEDETLATYLGGELAADCPQLAKVGARFELDAALVELTAKTLQPENAVVGMPGIAPVWPAIGLQPDTPLAAILGRQVAGVGAQSGPQFGELIGLSVQYRDAEDDPSVPPVFADYLIKPARGTDFGVVSDSGKLVCTAGNYRALGLYGGLGNFTADFGPATERWRRANDLRRIFAALGCRGPVPPPLPPVP